MKNQDKSKNAVLVEIATLLRYLADLVETLVSEKELAKERKETKEQDIAEAKEQVQETKQEPSMTFEMVRAALGEKILEGFGKQIHELIKTFGANKLSEIDPSNYDELMKKAEELKIA